MNEQNKFMTRCLELAKNGQGSVYPNPMVGSVIVHKGLIIGEGWHQKAGGPHAEVLAIDSVKNKELLPEATLYVNLEPCSHHGRTPPCADLILRNGIKKVVIGSVDSHEKVGGKGVKRLRENGVEVTCAIMEKQSRKLNKRFFTFHEKKRPYVILKWAESKDGYIFPEAELVEKGTPYWISNAYSLQRVHQWRAEEAAILVGKNTVLQDDPRLNIRDFKGNSILRIAIDRDLEIPGTMNFFDQTSKTIIYNAKKNQQQGDLLFVKLDFQKELIGQIMNHLHSIEVQSLIVEGGLITLNSFIRSGFWDEARVVKGEQIFKNGIKAPISGGSLVKEELIDNNLLQIYKRIL
jgi:diaminohydroxyphosphoribosylaminopyrimidine deaminase/5-amino-6-(5-phosphoribosylamino)uracil reductase